MKTLNIYVYLNIYFYGFHLTLPRTTTTNTTATRTRVHTEAHPNILESAFYASFSSLHFQAQFSCCLHEFS